METTSRFIWDNIDTSLTPEQIRSFLDHPACASDHIINWNELDLPEHAQILEIGCGLGETTRIIASTFPNASIIGTDISHYLIEIAKEKSNLGNISFQVADAHALPFETESVDLVISQRTFQHLVSPSGALKEMVRALKPGGQLLFIEPDRGSFLLDHENRMLTRTIITYLEETVRNPWIGRHLFPLLTSEHLSDIDVSVSPTYLTSMAELDRNYGLQLAINQLIEIKIIEPDSAKKWLDFLLTAESRQQLMGITLQFIASARKPTNLLT